MKNLILIIISSLIFISLTGQTNSDGLVEVKRSVFIDSPIDQLWELTAVDFGGIDKWNSDINVSEGIGEAFNDSKYNTRVCKSFPDDPNAYTEVLTEFDSKNHSFVYQPVSLPPNLKAGTTHWMLSKEGKGSILSLMQRLVFKNPEEAKQAKQQIEQFLGTNFERILDELKVYAETGKPHSNKVAAIEKYKKKLSSGAFNFKVFPPLESLESVYGQHEASPLVATHIKSSDNYVKVVYSRPALKDRKMIGETIPYGQVWRLGANEQTEISFTKNTTIGGKQLSASTYSLFAIPNEKEWTIIVNSALGDWGAFSFKEENNLHTFQTEVKKANQKFEKFTIWFADDGTAINIAWDQEQVSIPIKI